MKKYAIIEGREVVGVGIAPDLPADHPGAVEVPMEIDLDWLAGCVLDDSGGFVPRPVAPVPVPVPVASPGGWDIANCPAGTTITIRDLSGGELLARFTSQESDPRIALPDPGRYQIEIAPPFPHPHVLHDLEVP